MTTEDELIKDGIAYFIYKKNEEGKNQLVSVAFRQKNSKELFFILDDVRYQAFLPAT